MSIDEYLKLFVGICESVKMVDTDIVYYPLHYQNWQRLIRENENAFQ